MFQGSGSPPMAATTAGASVLNTSTDSNPDDDPNNAQQSPSDSNRTFLLLFPQSIIKKVRSRVSSIIPDALSKWFSPAAVKRPREPEPPASPPVAVVAVSGRNGNLLRDHPVARATSFGDGEPEQPELEDDEIEAPPTRKKKRLEDRFNTSLGDFNDDLSALPGPSGLNISAIDRRSSLPMSAQLPRSGRNAFSSSTPSTSPQSAAAGGLFHRQQQLQQKTSLIGHTNRTTVPYNFGTTTAAAADPINEESEELMVEEEGGFSNSIRHRRSIREVSGRKRLNIPQTAVDRSISEPPAPIFGGKTIFGRFTALPQQQQHQEELSDERREDPDVLVSNGTVNESASESSSVSNLNLSQSDQIEVGGSRRLSGFMGNVSRSKRMKVGGSTGDLCFSSHLETEKSLFSAKNSGRVGGVGGRPTFNASLYGSSSSLGSSNSSLFANSPFYNGKTMYGGASAYSARRDIRQKALRVPVQMRPASALSNFSSSNASLASDTSALSNTAKRILEIMNQCSGPLSEARKLGSSLSLNSTLASAKVPGLVQARKRFNVEDLNINRSIRMSSPRTPYSRPQSAATSTSSKPPTSELQIPSISQLLHMKRLQTNTESVRRMATESVGGGGGSILNEPTEYKLPEPDDSNNNVNAKHTNKIRSKLNRVREESAADRSSLHTPVPQLVLPEVTLAGLKSVPKFDIKVPAAAAAATANGGSNKNGDTTLWKSTTTGKEDATTQKTNAISSSSSATMKIASTATSLPSAVGSKVNSSAAYKFSSPTKLNLSDSGISLASAKSSTLNNFKFSNPEPLGSGKDAAAPSKLTGFQFNPETAKPKPMAVATVGTTSPVKAPLPLKSGSCLDALKSSGTAVPELKSGSCLQALAPSKPAAAGDFGNAFKLTGSNKWECEACMVRNDPDKAKCVACETPKPGAKPAKPSTTTATPPTTTDVGFKALVAQQSTRWECSDCMTRNDADKLKCVCCSSSKPGAAPAASVASAAAVPAAIKSMFAMPAAATTTAPSDQGFKSLAAQQSAGKWECSACMTRNEATRSKCACCEQAKPGSTPADAPSFSFGSSKSAAPSSGFSFGVPQNADTTNKDAPKSGFSFGVPASSSSSSAAPSGGFTFGSSTTTAPASSDDKPKFSFGSGASSVKPASTTGFSFGSKPSASTPDTTDSKTSEKKEEPKPATTGSGFGSGGFSFGAKPVTESAKPETVTSSSGGFSFGSPATASKTTAKPTTTETTATSLFGKTAPVAAAASPISTEPKKPVTFGAGSSPSFSFGSKPAANETKPSTATSGVAPATGMFSFGSPKPAGAATTETKDSGASSSGAAAVATPATATSVPIFGGAQKPAGPSITPGFSFSSSSSAATAVTTSTTASASASSSSSTTVSAPSFSFGSGAKPAEPKPSTTLGSVNSSFVFGQSSQPAAAASVGAKVVPSFGSTASSAVTSATDKPTATFGSFGATTGASSTSTGSSLFGSAAANTTSSAFSFTGAASKPTETSSPAFSFGSKPAQTPVTSAPVFGSPATATVTAKSMFGSPAASATSTTFGSFGASAVAPTPAGSNTATPTFGSSSFGVASPVAATGSGAGSIFGQSSAPAPAFGSAPAAFGGIASGSPFGAAVTASADEPQPKKVFEFGSSSAVGNSQPAATPFQFGSGSNNNNNNNNNDNGHKPFSFSAHSTPNFNFTAGSNAGQTSAPFTFGSGGGGGGGGHQSASAAAGGMFTFGSGGGISLAPAVTGLGGMAEAAPVVAAPAFQFGAAPTMPQQNPFAATSIPGQTQLQQQRRKISARRRMTPR